MDITYIDCPKELQDYALSGYDDYTTTATFWTTDKTLKVSLDSYLESDDITQGLPYQSLLIVGESTIANTKDSKRKLKELKKVSKVVKHVIPVFWDDGGWSKLVEGMSASSGVTLPRPLVLELSRSKSVSEISTILGKLSGLDTDEITLDLIRDIRGVDYVDFSSQIIKLINGEVISAPAPIIPFLYYASKRLDAYLRVRLGCFEGNRYQVKYLIRESRGTSTDALRGMAKRLAIAVGRVEISGPPPQNFFINLVDTFND